MNDEQKEQVRELVGDFTVVREFGLLHQGWEMDYIAWLIQTEDDRRLRLIFTTHGLRCFVAETDELRRQVESNLDVVREQQEVLALLDEQAHNDA